ncbi:MAG: NUDIX domain-containing protein [Pseudomonadota bacterium]
MADHPVIRKLFHTWFLFRRPMTLGVRVLVENDGKVLLVRHTYVSGWYFPGGGVESEETAEQAARKELLEETGIRVTGPISLLGVFLNRKVSKRDHVLLYKCAAWSKAKDFEANREIAEIGFFPIDALPQDTTPATRKRLMEVYSNEEVSQYW